MAIPYTYPLLLNQDDNQDNTAGGSTQDTTPTPQTQPENPSPSLQQALSPPTVPDVYSGYNTVANARASQDTPEFADWTQTDRPDVQSGTDFMDPNALVSTQLNKLIDSDSQYMKIAREQALEQMNNMGLLSSSMAIGASQSAAIRQALPIAQGDADVYKRLKEAEQAAVYRNVGTEYEGAVSSDLRKQQAINASIQKQVDDAWGITLKGLDQQTQADIENMRQEWNYAAQDALLKSNQYLEEMKVSADAQRSFNQRAQDLLNNYQISVQQLLASPEFLDNFGGNRSALNNMLNDLFQTTVAAITFDAQALGSYTPDMQNYIDNLKVLAQW